MTPDELAKFLQELLKNQVKELQLRVEANKYQRSVDESRALENIEVEATSKYGANLKK